MTSTELRMPSDLLKKFGAEIMPSGSYKRDERIRSVASSFENITESEEEDEEEYIRPTSPNGRSPYARSVSPSVQIRSSSLTRKSQSSSFLSGTFSAPRLTRVHSDPLIIRKNSFSLFKDNIPISKNSDCGSDTILSPIPEVASPLQSPASFGLYFNRL